MANPLAFRRNRRGPGNTELPGPGEERTSHQTEITPISQHPMDTPKAREVHRKLMSWYYYERDRQAQNRLEMATDHDFYDGLQWDPEDEAVLAERNQMALVYNEVAPMCDWVIGTERRNRVDWKILPRTEDDVQLADVKTKTLKYVSDVNNSAFVRSLAFADAVKGGHGYVDSGARDDPTQDRLYDKYEDWRCVLEDSSAMDIHGEDGRYTFRWRWVDEDIAEMMFPDRKDKIKAACEDWAFHFDVMDDEVNWQTPLDDATHTRRGGTMAPLAASSTAVDAQRRRVKLIECQWKEPMKVTFVADGPMRGAVFDPRDKPLVAAVTAHGSMLVDRISMRMHVAVFTESDMLAMGPSIYRHNRRSLTKFVCYRRGRDRMNYGLIRRVRGIQQDLNKRASKALWLLNTNQVIADRDAFEDPEQAREEAQDPQGVLLKKAGSEVRIQRDTDAATGQMQLMTMDAQAIQKSGGVTDENLGRKTNAVSGEAIKARQLQGSVVTTEPFDNARISTQIQGSKQLANVEQFYSEEKVIRLTGSQGRLEWLRINEPEVQPDGSVRYLNDVTASQADFIVSEADYAGSLRQVMFDSMMQISQRLPPEIALRLLRMAYEYSDLPNKNEIADEIRRLTGETDPNKPMTPEEQAQAEANAKAQQEAMQIQRDTAIAALDEARAKVREINARAEKALAEAQSIAAGDGADMQGQIERAIAQTREQAAGEIDKLTQQLAKVTASNEAAILKVRSDADTQAEVARIQAASAERVAEIEKASDKALETLSTRMQELTRMASELQGTVKRLEKRAIEDDAEDKAEAKMESKTED